MTLSYRRLVATITYEDSALSHSVLVLVTTDNFFLFQDFEGVAFAGVLLLDKQHFSVRAFANDANLIEVFGRHAGCLLSLVGDEFLIFLDLFLPLDNLEIKKEIGLTPCFYSSRVGFL